MSGIILIISVSLWGLTAGLLAWRVLSSSGEAMANYRATFTESASDNLSDMFVFIDPGKIFYMNMLALVLSFPLVWLLTGSLLMGAGAAVIVWLLPQWAYRRLHRMRLERFMIQLPDGLAMLSGSMQAGASLNMALEGLVKEDSGNAAFSDGQLILTQQGHDKFVELMQGNLRDTSGELSRLIMALKMRYLHLLDDDIRREQLEILQDVCELDLERVLALREEHANEASNFTGWLEMEVKRLEQKNDWLKSLLV